MTSFSFLNSEVVADRPKVPRKVVDELPEIEEDATPEVEEEELLSYIDETVVVFKRQAGKSTKVIAQLNDGVMKND